MITLDIKVYEIFKSKFSEQEATTVIEYFEAKTEQKFTDKKDNFLTKQDKIDLIEKIETALFALGYQPLTENINSDASFRLSGTSVILN